VKATCNIQNSIKSGGNYNNYIGYIYYSDYMATTTIQLETKVRDLLKSFGRKGDTYNDIILKLIKRARYVEYMKESYDILDKEENWVSLEELE
jgi:hypothetical protein